jgi:DNA repair protein RadC
MKNLSNTDLLALLVGSAAKKLSTKPLAELFGFSKPRQMQLCEEQATYVVHPSLAAAKELFIRCIQEHMETECLCASSPEPVKAFLCSKIGHLEYESFVCLWLDTRFRLQAVKELFRGTLSATSVYPREVVKRALAHNAAAVIFAHNHSSGVAQPSPADKMMTHTLSQALSLIDVKVADHFIVAGNRSLSFKEEGLL